MTQSLPNHIPEALLDRQRSISRFGWRPDLPDPRDAPLSLSLTPPQALPSSVDLRTTGFLPQVWSQGNLGACTGHGLGALVAFLLKARHSIDFMPSRLFIYYNERVIENTVDTDAGALIRDGIKAIAKVGVCSEDDWAYDTSQFAVAPPKKAYDDAVAFEALAYQKVDPSQFRATLAAQHPIVFGFTVFPGFETPAVHDTGIVPMPDLVNEHAVGGHCVLMVGYDDVSQMYLCRNSWGSQWGQQGYFQIPYAYLNDPGLASDFWTITELTYPKAA